MLTKNEAVISGTVISDPVSYMSISRIVNEHPFEPDIVLFNHPDWEYITDKESENGDRMVDIISWSESCIYWGLSYSSTIEVIAPTIYW